MSDTRMYFLNPKTVKKYSDESFIPFAHINIDLGEKSYIYYFSVLIGTQLYAISDLEDRAMLLMDQYNNFYEIDGLGGLNWIGKSAEGAFAFLLLSKGEYFTLNEESLLWMKNKTSKMTFTPPVNTALKGINPWLDN